MFRLQSVAARLRMASAGTRMVSCTCSALRPGRPGVLWTIKVYTGGDKAVRIHKRYTLHREIK